MKICIIGAGASGMLFAIRVKELHPNHEVFCLEKNARVGKKILATGNGKCNLANSSLIREDTYSNYSQIRDIVNCYDFLEVREYLESLGIKLKMQKNLCYPYSESASSVVEILYSHAIHKGVRFELEKNVIDYRINNNGSYEIITNDGKYYADHLVFACGGKSTPNLGSDGSLFAILEKHGYEISPLFPGLCPLKTIEQTKMISGLRVKALVSLYVDNKKVYMEEGEVLFKDDGLSGIVIFNISSLIARGKKEATYQISLNLFPDETSEEILEQFKRDNKGIFSFLNGYFQGKFAQYILDRTEVECTNKYDVAAVRKLVRKCYDLTFTFRKLYGFDSSQVTVGGLSLANLNHKLCSKIEPHVSFIGEVLDVDGLCGGYNLMWAIVSAMHLAKHLR